MCFRRILIASLLKIAARYGLHLCYSLEVYARKIRILTNLEKATKIGLKNWIKWPVFLNIEVYTNKKEQRKKRKEYIY